MGTAHASWVRLPSAPAVDPEQREAPYLDALVAHAGRHPGRFHVPGHKGGLAAGPELRAALGEGTLQIDLPTCIDGVDLGPDPTPLERARELAARTWGARRTWFLVGGASEGAQAVCLAMARAGASAVVQRNVHVSTVHGLVLSGLRPTFVHPVADEDLDMLHCISPERLNDALERVPAAAVFVVSPTYFGVAGDVAGMAEVAHAHGAALVVDEAWGAHFAFHPSLPEDALAAGADLVISGTHKMIGSLTQSAMLHLGTDSSGLVDEEDLNRALAIVQSTSPSSLLLASLDAARRMAATRGPELLERAIAGAAVVREELRRVPGVEVLDEHLVGRCGVTDFDPLRVVIDVRATGASGHHVFQMLHRVDDVHLELATEEVLVLHLGMAEDPAPYAELLAAALERAVAESLDRGVRRRRFFPRPSWGSVVLTPREAYMSPHEAVPLREAPGRIAAESLSVYPPGTAIIMPGERVTAASVAFIERTLRQGGHVRGSPDPTAATTLVVSRRHDPAEPSGAYPEPKSMASPGVEATNGSTSSVESAFGPVAASSHTAFENFPARAYLEKYYSGVGPENTALLGTLIDYLAATEAPTGRVIEVAGGPSLFSMLALAAVRGEPFERVLFTDLGRENLREVERWLDEDPDRFDYAHVLAWLEERVGASRDSICLTLRSSRWQLASFDWRHDPPREWCGGFDVVSSHFFAESATSNEEEFIAMMRRIPRLGRPGALMFMSFMSGSHGYRIDGAAYPGFEVDETSLLAYFRDAGVSLSDLFLRTVAAEDPASDPGYEGLLFVAGRLFPTAEPGH